MDSLQHAAQKIHLDTNTTTPSQPTPPPAYTTAAATDFSDDDDTTTSVILNASTQVRGSFNIITTTPLDTPRISALFVALMKGAPNAVAPERIKIQINCGVTIVGDRNVVGTIPVRPRPQATVAVVETQNAAEGEGDKWSPKRKAEEDPSDIPSSKKVEIEVIAPAS
ncbi:hypothetical protein K432DRAFT_382031 [Lepidopterella palustris CBS 459.81]|uniref:Uncharacterized protein n=1 Tax=Lepidopterella palustris CBS 459.81 TaxID=1314670 RepID=A0A8E2EB05_9PEZI|nr:hypothetical protein K432DRAFT_382031 [Lepidopterella palustris CBS 459.81]